MQQLLPNAMYILICPNLDQKCQNFEISDDVQNPLIWSSTPFLLRVVFCYYSARVYKAEQGSKVLTFWAEHRPWYHIFNRCCVWSLSSSQAAALSRTRSMLSIILIGNVRKPGTTTRLLAPPLAILYAFLFFTTRPTNIHRWTKVVFIFQKTIIL